MCAMRTSSTRQPGCSGSKLSRNCCAERNVAALKPTEATSSAIESSTASSSSTMNTVGSGMSSVSYLRNRQREPEGASTTGIRRQRQASAMRLDDGAGDRQADAQPGFLGPVERIGNGLGIARSNSRPRVGDADRDLTVSVSLDSDTDRSGMPGLLHRLDGVAG